MPNNTPNHLIDCSKIELVTKANILKSDGTTKLAYTVTNVGVVNNILHSMWSNVNVELNNKTVTHNDGLYPYKAYLEKLTTFTPEHTKTFGVRSGFVMDEANNMDGNVVKRQADAVTETVKDDPGGRAVTVIKTLAVEENYMAKRMAGYFHGNGNTPGATTYSDGLSTVPFNTKFLLPHKIEMKINLQRHDHTFYMMDGTAHGYRIVIEDITLRVPYAIVTDEIFMKIERGISAHGAKMPVSRIGIIEDTIAKGTTIATIQGLIKGNMPDQVYIAMVENGVTKGDKAKNPFNFQHFNLKEYEIRAAGRTFPNNRMPLDFGNGQYLPAWLDLMRTMDMESDGFGSLIDYEDYPDGFTIIGVDLTAALPSDVYELEVILKPVIASYQGVFNHDCLKPIIDYVSKSEDQPKELTLIIQTDDLDSKGEHYQAMYMDLRPDCRHVVFLSLWAYTNTRRDKITNGSCKSLRLA